jgi:3-dehydroquinate synthase
MNLTIASSFGAYDVLFFESLNQLIETLVINTKKMVCVIDSNVVSSYPQFCGRLQQHGSIFHFDATEENKTIIGLTQVLAFMQQQGVNKSTTLVVIGGGITQDVCALAAHIYYRGIPYVLIPTTLLSMADSCVGAKSSLNFNQHKNQLGAFYPPRAIYICPDFLDTLSISDIYSGCGEIFKLFLIDNSLDTLNLAGISERSDAIKLRLLSYIARALEIKKEYIEKDEFDQNERKILNYGHTFGHGIEALTHHAVPHGLAILLGIDIVNYISVCLGLLEEQIFFNIHQQISSLYDWSIFNLKLNENALVDSIRSDKKAEANTITLALLTTDGKMLLKRVAIGDRLIDFITHYIAKYALDFSSVTAKEIS